MRILAIDHGIARCGCAISDPTGALSTPLPVIEPTEARAVAALAAAQGAERIVIGLPVSLDGEEGEQASLARDFAEAVRELAGVPVETYDERFTTAMAQASMRGGAGAAEDSLAAAHLLESYLSSLARGGSS